MRASRGRRVLLCAVGVVTLALSAVACTDGGAKPGPSPTTGPTAPAVDELTFGVYGPDAEIAAYRASVDAWNAAGEDRPQVKLRTWPDHAAMRAAIDGGAEVPDVFLASRSDLRWLLDERHNQPVDELLDARGVEFGDGYSRDALQAFSANDRLQCIPYSDGTTDYAIHIFHDALIKGSYQSFLSGDTELPMMYMDDAIRGTIELMNAPADRLTIRSSYNFAGMSFNPEDLAAEIRKHLPDFRLGYLENDPRQAIANSWPQSIDDSRARNDWNWNPRFDLAKMTSDMLHNLKK